MQAVITRTIKLLYPFKNGQKISHILATLAQKLYSFMSITINREASDKTKGFRLQKLRAVLLMLKSAQLSSSATVYWAIEHLEDVFEKKEGEEYLEEDKDYSKSSSFTFNHQILRNTLVSFMDIWISKEYSANLFLGFYSTNSVGKESNTENTKKMGIILPDEALLKSAINKNYTSEFLDAVKKFLIKEYQSQYRGKNKGHINAILNWSDEAWKGFFNRITWQFNKPNAEELEAEVLEKIKECKWYSSVHHNGYEDIIMDKLIGYLDSRQNKKDFLERFVHKPEVEMVFMRLQQGKEPKVADAIWKMWDKTPEPTDKRSVKEKLLSVCDNLNVDLISDLEKSAIEGSIERLNHETDSKFKSMRYRVYSKCSKILTSKLENLPSDNEMDESQVKEIITSLQVGAKEEINDISESYDYPIKAKTIIDNIVLELFDSCYLALDNG